jgi:hypothetical protein
MSRARMSCLLAGATTVALLASVQSADAAPSLRPTLTASISAHGVVTMPRTIRPGRVKIAVTGHRGEELQLVKPRHGAGRTNLISDVAGIGVGKPRALEHDFALLGGALTGASFEQTVTPGTYYVIDANLARLTKNTITEVTVAGARVDAAAPALTGSISAIADMSWSGKPASIAHSGYLRFRNASSSTHFLVLSQLKPHATLADVRALLTAPDADPSTVFTGIETDSGVLSPGQQETLSYSLPKGRYAVLCFWPDDQTGMSHAAMGMVRLIELR